MVRDEIQIRAEKKYLFEHAIAEGLKQGREQGLQRGMAEGLEIGMEQGRFDAMREIAARLKAMGMEDEYVAAATGLPTETIKEISLQ